MPLRMNLPFNLASGEWSRRTSVGFRESIDREGRAPRGWGQEGRRGPRRRQPSIRARRRGGCAGIGRLAPDGRRTGAEPGLANHATAPLGGVVAGTGFEPVT